MSTSPAYDPEYHFPISSELPVAEMAGTERCYINLDPEDRCPKCGSEHAVMIYADGPVRTKPRLLKIMARVYRCDSCGNGYLAAEVVE